MLKTIILSVWGALVTIGAVYGNMHLSTQSDEVKVEKASYDDHMTDTLTIAIFHKGKVIGHLATRIKYKLPDTMDTDGPIPIKVMIEDGLYEVVYKMRVGKLMKLEEKDLIEIGTNLTQLLNQRKTPLPIVNALLHETQILMN